MKLPSLFAIILLGCLGGASVRADLMVLPVEGAGNIGLFFPLNFAFDNQPTNVPTVSGAALAGYVDAGSYPPSFTNRWGYIDLGEDYANLRIQEAWTGYRTFSGGHVSSPYQEVFWSDIISTNSAGTTAELDINFLTTASVTHTGSMLWYRDWQAADESDAVTPAARYLILHSNGTAMSNRAMEYALVGTIVPEPGTGLLLLLGAGILLRRRRSPGRP